MPRLTREQYETMRDSGRRGQLETKLPRQWSLIQRLERRPLERAERMRGFDRIFACDYMGAAEFEFGAVGKTVRAIREIVKHGNGMLIDHQLPIAGHPTGRNKTVWIICHKEADPVFLDGMLHSLAVDDPMIWLKEPHYFNHHCEAMSLERHSMLSHRLRTEAWLVLDELFPVLWTVDEGLARAAYEEFSINKGVKPEDLHVFQQVKFDHAGRTHVGEVKCIYEDVAIIDCADPNLRGRQRIGYGEIWK